MKNLFYISTVLLLVSCAQKQNKSDLSTTQPKNSTIILDNDINEKVILMGNSIVEGWSGFRPEFFADKSYINKGIGGETTPQMLARFQQDVIDLKPKAVVILAGINDIAENTGPIPIPDVANNIFKMAKMATEHDIQVVLCSVLPAHDFPWRQGMSPDEKVPKLNALIKAYAVEKDIVYIDYFTAMVDDDNGLKKELGYDGVHPNADGYAIMEPLLEQAISLLQK